MALPVKISVMMAVHGRIELTLQCIYHIEEIILDATGSLPEIFTACSTDDEERELKDAGCTVVKCDNFPVSEKHNKMLNLAMGGAEWTHILHLGSDNFITKLYLKKIMQAARSGHDIIGTPELSVIRPNVQKAIHFKYINNKLKVLGAGRLFSRKVLENTISYPHKCTRTYYSFRTGDIVNVPKGLKTGIPLKQISDVKQDYILWPHAANNGLDLQSMALLENYAETHVISFPEPQVLDVKVNDENITQWARLYDPRKEVSYPLELERFNIDFLK